MDKIMVVVWTKEADRLSKKKIWKDKDINSAKLALIVLASLLKDEADNG